MTDLTAIVAAYVQAFEQQRAATAGEPPALSEARSRALAAFEARGLPSHRQPNWRYTEIGAITARPFLPSAGDVTVVADTQLEAHRLPDAYQLTFVNGVLLANDGHLPALTGEAFAGRLADALVRWPERVLPVLAASRDLTDQPFVALNTAYARDGACLLLPAGQSLDRPLQLLFWTTPRFDGQGMFVRNLLVLGSGSEATIVETHVGDHGTSCLSCPVTDIVLANASRLQYYRWQAEGQSTHHVGQVRASLASQARWQAHSLVLTRATSRLDVEASLVGEGAECALDGLYLPTSGQAVDHHVLVRHETVGGTSHQLFKGILEGDARAVFHGRIVVRPGAQKTNAFQANHHLLLSRQAVVRSQPQLEILADDVQCTHGATVGQLDDEALFYLRSRGVDEPTARSLLVYAFAGEVIDRLQLAAVRNRFLNELARRLPQGELVSEIEALGGLSLDPGDD